jgi:penicillin V acylase-like amidase (Ntn superfamily)
MSCRIIAVIGVAVVALGAGPADSCTTFCMQDGQRIVFGKSYDWHIRSGMLVVNQRSMARVAMAYDSGGAAQWTARYGSVTFNQFGRDFPMGGINEAGLVVEVMWLDEALYPTPDHRSSIGDLQWIQYQLDNAATVAEVLASDAWLRIVETSAPLHFLVADASGAVATVEFLEGHLVAHSGADLPVPALTNSTYDDSLRYLVTWPQGNGTTSSLDRFVTAATRTLSFPVEPPDDAVAYAFDTLAAVAQPGWTRWRIVYAIDQRRLSFFTDATPHVRSIDLDDLDLACGHPVQVLDLSEDLEGDVSDQLTPYTYEHNLALIEHAYANVPFLSGTPQSALEQIAHYPDHTSCQPPEPIRSPSGRIGVTLP